MPKGVYIRTEETKQQLEKIGYQKGQVMERSGHWKDGRTKMITGYILIKKPTHPFCDCRGYILEHRLVIEKHFERYLQPRECVHHINEDSSDNRIKNLMVFRNITYHRWFHTNGFCNSKGIIFDGHCLQ